jgi:predicted acetyltransferase
MCRPTHLKLLKKMKTLSFATKSCDEEKKLHNNSYILKTFHERKVRRNIAKQIHCQIFLFWHIIKLKIL